MTDPDSGASMEPGLNPGSMEVRELLEKREKLVEAQDAIKRAGEGDESALPAVRAYLDERGPEYLDAVDVARIATETQIERVFGPEDLASGEAAARKTLLMRREILGPDPSPLEGLLADRIVLCWWQLYYSEIQHAEEVLMRKRHADMESMTWAQDEWHQKRIDRLQRRYLASIKSLAQVRKLLGPGSAVQINVAEQQVNVAGDLKRHPR